jgi:hypothetical protein
MFAGVGRFRTAAMFPPPTCWPADPPPTVFSHRVPSPLRTKPRRPDLIRAPGKRRYCRRRSRSAQVERYPTARFRAKGCHRSQVRTLRSDPALRTPGGWADCSATSSSSVPRGRESSPLGNFTIESAQHLARVRILLSSLNCASTPQPSQPRHTRSAHSERFLRTALGWYLWPLRRPPPTSQPRPVPWRCRKSRSQVCR